MHHRHDNDLPLKFIDVALVEDDRRLSQQLIKPPETLQNTAQVIDYESLTAADRRICDEGDLLPLWASRWLELTAQIAYEETFGPCTALIVPVRSTKGLFKAFPTNLKSSWEVQILTVEDMCIALSNRAHRLGFVLAWGVSSRAINTPHFPLDCRGFMLPIVDGMGILFAADEQTRELLDI
ncbi:MAG: hypothetical protein AAGC93_22805 [Cyanobacteria bacterium P01_F01_bin.53]